MHFNFQRGRHASKLTEEEEDEEYLKEEEDGLSGSGNTRLLVQPSCITLSLSRLPFLFFLCMHIKAFARYDPHTALT